MDGRGENIEERRFQLSQLRQVVRASDLTEFNVDGKTERPSTWLGWPNDGRGVYYVASALALISRKEARAHSIVPVACLFHYNAWY